MRNSWLIPHSVKASNPTWPWSSRHGWRRCWLPHLPARPPAWWRHVVVPEGRRWRHFLCEARDTTSSTRPGRFHYVYMRSAHAVKVTVTLGSFTLTGSDWFRHLLTHVCGSEVWDTYTDTYCPFTNTHSVCPALLSLTCFRDMDSLSYWVFQL